jgi:hypothetical protein
MILLSADKTSDSMIAESADFFSSKKKAKLNLYEDLRLTGASKLDETKALPTMRSLQHVSFDNDDLNALDFYKKFCMCI